MNRPVEEESIPALGKWEGPAMNDLWSVQMQLQAGGTNFASVGINYTVTFIIQNYGKCNDSAPLLSYILLVLF